MIQHIQFNKTICGVDFLLNVVDSDKVHDEFSGEAKSADFFQIIFIESVEGQILLNQDLIDLKPFSVIFISQHQKYLWKVNPSTFKARCLVFQEDFLNEFFADRFFTYRLLYFYQSQHPLQLKLNQNDLERYQSILTEINKEIKHPKSDSVHLIRSLLYYLLIQLNREYAELNHINTAISLNNEAYHFRLLVEQNIYKLQRVDDYASIMQMSRISLNKIVKSQFNITATDFIKSRILFEIKNMLIHTHMTVAEISDRLNFSEPNHMSRLFKSKEGISPIDFRLNYQNGSIK